MADSGGTFWAPDFWAADFWADGFWAGIVAGDKDFEGVVMFHDQRPSLMYHDTPLRLMLHGRRDAIAHTGVCRTMIAETS